MKRNITSCFVGIAAAFFLFAFAQNSFAQATLSIQGIIQKSNGAAVDDGKYDLTFKLYATPSGGTAVHTETQNIAVAGGIYSAELGNGGTPLTAAFDQTYYLGVSVDGGTELIPRARLTSSPYSLALLGTSNLFPSSGAIGAGTINPASGFQIHARNPSGTGNVLVSGSSGALVNFEREGVTSGQIGVKSDNNDFVINSNNNTAVQYAGTTKLLVTNNGIRVPAIYTSAGVGHLGLFVDATERIRVHGGGAQIYGEGYVSGILGVGQGGYVNGSLAIGQGSIDASVKLRVEGASYLNGFVEINGSRSISLGNGGRFVTSNGCSYDHLCQFNSGSFDFGLKVNSRVAALEFFAFSDRRIKKDFHLSKNLADLATLRNLRVTDYRHIDEIDKGSDFKKGFIAQEVKEVFPEAVTLSAGFIPDVYALSTKTQLTSDKMTITLDKKHGFAAGDEVKLMLPSDNEKRATVLAVTDANTFVVDWKGEAAADKVFVFGKKINDFHTVDYDRIFTLNVSATQELARKVELLEKENAALKSTLSKKDEEIEGMKASAEKFDARLRALENKLSN